MIWKTWIHNPSRSQGRGWTLRSPPVWSSSTWSSFRGHATSMTLLFRGTTGQTLQLCHPSFCPDGTSKRSFGTRSEAKDDGDWPGLRYFVTGRLHRWDWDIVAVSRVYTYHVHIGLSTYINSYNTVIKHCNNHCNTVILVKIYCLIYCIPYININVHVGISPWNMDTLPKKSIPGI